MRIGYLVPEFPSQTHIFFWREIEALRRLGTEVFLVSTRKPLSSNCRHEFARSAVSETHYIFPPSFSSLASWAVSGCPGLWGAVSYFNGLEHAGFKARTRHYGLLPSAVDLTHWAQKMRIEHIHGQSCATAAHVLALVRRMGGPT